ncbi:MAG: right-handed parallel beta-helix repeat-containing protein [bacterium]
MSRRSDLVVSLLLLETLSTGACGDDQAACPRGFERQGASCVPIFDDCAGPAEISVRGGGCSSVGVTYCATGLFEPDGEGGCDAILPPLPGPCPAGSMEVLGRTTCQPVGVTECAPGFTSDGEGGCDALLPPGPDPCPPGTIALLGHTECVALGDCGSGAWGEIVDDGQTVFVDQTADATGADGSPQAPFVSIGEALAAALPGGQVAIAAGDYTERLSLNRPVRLTGRCAALVTIRGSLFLGNPAPAVTVAAGGTGTSIRGVTLTGPGVGLVVEGAQQVTAQELQVLDAGDMGIAARQEAELSLQRVVVARCATAGVYSSGSTLELRESVVRDTRAHPASGTLGRGVNVECASSGICGSLRVSSCVVSDNRAVGIAILDVDTEITAAVVRNTQSEENSLTGGRGIHAECQTTDRCGGLLVSSSLVEANREMGIYVTSLDAEIRSTVVRDTQSAELDGWWGRGIAADCSLLTEACGSLRVSSCLVSGNRETGISSGGVDTEITATVVQDNRSEQGTGWFGRGVAAQCSSLDVCPVLQVSSSLVTGNQEMGIYSIGADTDITSTVVRDNLPEELTQKFGWGIGARCDTAVGRCGSLHVSASLVEGNLEGGVAVVGADTDITATVVRSTLPDAAWGLPGRGVNAQCDQDTRDCGTLLVTSSLVEANVGFGINIAGVDAEVADTTVRGTLPEDGRGLFGRGVGARCDPGIRSCGSLLVSSSLIASNVNAGIFSAGTPTTLEGVAVIDTRPNTFGEWEGIYSQGIWALCDPETGDCGGLWMTGCLVESAESAGVAVEGVSGFVASSTVRNVSPQSLDGKYGYGVQIGGLETQQGDAMPVFSVYDCVIQDAALAGILYFRARGAVTGSAVSGAENSVVMNEGSEPTILETNALSGTVENEPTWANLFPSPAPPPALPLEH